ncbi:MAG TPA: molybdopterin cofactor-binding domain-containing protein, partial [Sumerlaeia bacterium]|nr:molybdopterin cofactor-binding domain-containing protein [Sumerlaeia bacterium]
MKETEKQLEPDSQDPKDAPALDRREFLKSIGGGVLVLFSLGDDALAQRGGGRPPGQQLPEDFNAFLRIGEDGRVSCFTGKIEMGQGIVTSLAQMLADELDTPLDSVDMVMGDTDLCPWDMGTFGSMSTRFFGPPLRAAAAEARSVLLELAAERLKAPLDRLKTKDGVVFDSSNGEKRVTYAQLTEGKKITRRLGKEAVLKTPERFTIVGKPVTRTDAEAKVTGKAKYAGDILLPGMLYARILRPPAHGATLKEVDTSAAEKVDGVRVVRDGDLVAVLAPDPELAEQALERIDPQYETPELPVDDKTIFEHLLRV